MRLYILLALQSFQVTILLLHDWLPLSPLNDVRAARRGHSLLSMTLATVISSLFPSIGLVLGLFYLKSGWPGWLHIYLLAAYGFLFVGELEAWWVPYLVRPQPKRAAPYEAMYGKTWAFLPPRNGIRINTLHFVLHAATLATLLILASPLRGQGVAEPHGRRSGTLYRGDVARTRLGENQTRTLPPSPDS